MSDILWTGATVLVAVGFVLQMRDLERDRIRTAEREEIAERNFEYLRGRVADLEAEILDLELELEQARGEDK